LSKRIFRRTSSANVANPVNRYVPGSPMLPQVVKDGDGGLTFHIQNETPGKDKEPNWLLARTGPFFIAMRLYWPEALDGTWKQPPMQRVVDQFQKMMKRPRFSTEMKARGHQGRALLFSSYNDQRMRIA
jgi:hypothetical protein